MVSQVTPNAVTRTITYIETLQNKGKIAVITVSLDKGKEYLIIGTEKVPHSEAVEFTRSLFNHYYPRHLVLIQTLFRKCLEALPSEPTSPWAPLRTYYSDCLKSCSTSETVKGVGAAAQTAFVPTLAGIIDRARL